VTIPKDEEMHDRIMQAFREYFKANQDWMNKGTRRAGMDVRNRLNDIKHLCIERRKHVMDWRYDLDAEKFERKKNQKGKGKAGDQTN
jgi:hypothetical protein